MERQVVGQTDAVGTTGPGAISILDSGEFTAVVYINLFALIFLQQQNVLSLWGFIKGYL